MTLELKCRCSVGAGLIAQLVRCTVVAEVMSSNLVQAAAFLLEDKPAEETPETQEGEFSCSAEKIPEAQHSDLDIHPVITQMKKGRSPPTAKELRTHSSLTRAIYAQYPFLDLEDNISKLKPKDEPKSTTNLESSSWCTWYNLL